MRERSSTWGLRRLGALAAFAFATLKELAPYAAIELLLPGGSLMALTLWFYRRRKRVPNLSMRSYKCGVVDVRRDHETAIAQSPLRGTINYRWVALAARSSRSLALKFQV
jgi:hypothetical protein